MEEFDYCCLFDTFPSPPPLKTWAEQLSDGEYTLTSLSPLTSIDGVGVIETRQQWDKVLSDDGMYFARVCECTLVDGLWLQRCRAGHGGMGRIMHPMS